MSKADSIPTTETAGAAAPVTLRSLADAGDKALLEISMGLEAIRTIALQIEHDGGDGAGLTFCINQIGALLDGSVQPLVNYGMGARPPGFTEAASEAGGADCPSLEELRKMADAIPDRALPAAVAALRLLAGDDKPDIAGEAPECDAQDDAPAGPTVASVYAAWLVARGAERQAGTEAAGEAAAADAWSLALSAFPMPARERWEVAHKVEMLDWMLAPGTVDPHVRRAAFAGILADLEG